MAILDIAEARQAARVDADEENLLVQAYSEAATAWINRVTGKAFDETAPEDVKQAAKMLVAHWFDQRSAVSEVQQRAVPFGVRTLIANHRTFAHGLPAGEA